MNNSNDSFLHTDITLNDNKLEEVNKFCYLGATLSKDGSMEIGIRLALATSSIIRLYIKWNSRYIHFKLKYNLYHLLVLSILTYGCEAWTISTAMQKKLQAFENKSHIKLLDIKYQDKNMNVYVKEKLIAIVGKYNPLLHMIKRRKLKWYGHISRHEGLIKTIMQGIVEDSRKQDRPKSQWFNNISDWTKMDAN